MKLFCFSLSALLTISSFAAEPAASAHWVSVAHFHLMKNGNIGKLLAVDSAVRTFQKAPNSKIEDVLGSSLWLENSYNDMAATAENSKNYHWLDPQAADVGASFNKVLQKASGKSPLKSVSLEILSDLTTFGLKTGDYLYGPSAQVDSRLTQSAYESSARQYGYSALERAYAVAKENPAAAKVIDAIFAGSMNGSVNSDDAALRAAEPEFFNQELLQGLYDHAGPGGKLSGSVDDLRRAMRSGLSKIQDKISRNLEVLKDSEDRAERYRKDQALAIEAAKREEIRLKSEAILSEAARSGLYLMSKMLGAADPEAGHAFSVAGNAMVSMAEALDKFATRSAFINSLSDKIQIKGLSFSSSLTLTSDLVGAVSAIVSLALGGKDGTTLILEEIGKLHTQIRELGGFMEKRFNQIDDSLNRIYGAMLEQFDELKRASAKNLVEVKKLQDQISFLQERLERMDRSLTRKIDEGFALDHKRALLATASHLHLLSLSPELQREGAKHFEPASKHLNDLHLCATAWASGPSQAGSVASVPAAVRTEQKYFVHLSSEMDSLAPHALVVPIAEMLRRDFGLKRDLKTEKLINPIFWNRCVNAYVRLASAWPDFYKFVVPEQAIQMQEYGNGMRTFLWNVSAALREEPSKEGSLALLEELFTDYRQQLITFYDTLEATLREIQSEQVAGYDSRSEKGLHQTAEPSPNAGTINITKFTCETGQQPGSDKPFDTIELDAPYFAENREAALEHLVGKEFLAATYFKLGDLQVDCYAKWVEKRTHIDKFVPGHWDENIIGKPRLYFRTYYVVKATREQPVPRRVLVKETWLTGSEELISRTAHAHVTNHIGPGEYKGPIKVWVVGGTNLVDEVKEQWKGLQEKIVKKDYVVHELSKTTTKQIVAAASIISAHFEKKKGEIEKQLRSTLYADSGPLPLAVKALQGSFEWLRTVLSLVEPDLMYSDTVLPFFSGDQQVFPLLEIMRSKEINVREKASYEQRVERMAKEARAELKRLSWPPRYPEIETTLSRISLLVEQIKLRAGESK